MDMCYNKTIAKIGEKAITVKTFCNEKIRISAFRELFSKEKKEK